MVEETVGNRLKSRRPSEEVTAVVIGSEAAGPGWWTWKGGKILKVEPTAFADELDMG